jgi:hypothetical protein
VIQLARRKERRVAFEPTRADDSQRTGLNITLTPATAANPVGTSHTVTATVTSTDPDGHPTAVFSAEGFLLSVPALVPSLADPGSQAPFGFVVQCCGARGNLEYNDHSAGVRIKATSISTLLIFNGSCGSNTHARFTGTADVIRSTGTTSESFTGDVDDCGEPGTADTFGIQTMSYSNGPSTLIGGNIQIHK